MVEGDTFNIKKMYIIIIIIFRYRLKFAFYKFDYIFCSFFYMSVQKHTFLSFNCWKSSQHPLFTSLISVMYSFYYN